MDNKRAAARVRTFFKGQIDLEGGLSNCLIKDISNEGARLLLSRGVTLPETFRVYLPKQACWVRATVRWRHGDYIGVKFQDPPPNAIVHHAAADPSRIEQLENEILDLRAMVEGLRGELERMQTELGIAA